MDGFEAEIRRLLKDEPRMPATVIAERIGWTRGLTVLRERVNVWRADYVAEQGFQRTEYRPGELGQWDLWWPAVNIPVGYGQALRLPVVVVGVSGFSRWIVGRMVDSKQSHDVLGGHEACLVDLGGVPRLGVYDGEPAISSRREGRVVYTEPFLRFKGTFGMGSVVLEPGHPERKGLVERVCRYLETSFLPGRRFVDPADFNVQLREWRATRANRRVHSGLRCRPTDRIEQDRAAMLPLPPILPDVDWHHQLRLGRDHWVRFDTNDYSVHPNAIGRRVHIRADLDTVSVTCGGEEVACHQRVLARHVTVTDPVHERARRAPAQLAAPAASDHDDAEVAVRDLAEYDRALGVAG